MKKNKKWVIAGSVFVLVFLFSWRLATVLQGGISGENLVQQLESILISVKSVFITLPKFSFSALGVACFYTLTILILLAFAFSGKLLKQWQWDSYYDYKRKSMKVRPKSMEFRTNLYGANDLSEMIGLENVKKEIDQILTYHKVQQMRKKKGLSSDDLNLNFVFYGKPGTGKTVVARYIAKELRENGILKKGQMFEADRSLMVSSQWGETPALVHEVVEASLGGVLFIDEAYTLTATRDEAGHEAIATLLKLMEDYRDKLVVIVAGYDELMQDFIDSNPGLESRFTKHIHFRDYTADELVQIFEIFARKRDYVIDAGARQALMDYFKYKIDRKDENFSNGRLARNVFEESIAKQAIRVGHMSDVSKEQLMEIVEEDVPLV